jgi:hypothetical protein|mmetsp:Transcript_19012/g.25729  ORF Transcript_19012/g.25729 Transcript_19012/m.25729 type:complete len:92 (+) Transcript_19012:2155-2430(+)
MTAAKNTEAFTGANQIGSNILNKLNLGGLGGLGGGQGGGPSVMASMQGLGKAGGGYQPKMFGAKSAASDVDSNQGTDRYSAARFGAGSSIS